MKILVTVYEHARTVWKTFECNTMGDYDDLYLKTDVPILADVFENFRKTSMQYYNLDISHYFSSPGFAWDAMLKMTGARLELTSKFHGEFMSPALFLFEVLKMVKLTRGPLVLYQLPKY